jgi:glucose-1-phosphate cytidylyltransferase
LNKGEDLVGHAFPRLAVESKLQAVPYHGFWAAMDTLKERSVLEEMYRGGNKPWAVWSRSNGSDGTSGYLPAQSSGAVDERSPKVAVI